MITNNDDIIDSRDIIARIEQLQVLRTAGAVPDGILDDDDYTTDQDTLFRELAALEAMAAEAADYCEDWEYGAQLIRDNYFTEYTEELAEDIGAYSADSDSWPLRHIDWEAAARELKQDYANVEFGGVTYWVR